MFVGAEWRLAGRLPSQKAAQIMLCKQGCACSLEYSRGPRNTDLLMFEFPDYANEECMHFSSTAETRNVCTSPQLRKRGVCVLFLDCGNKECVYSSSTAQTRNVCTLPRLRSRGMCVLLLDYANEESERFPDKQQNGRLSPAAFEAGKAG